jgi:[ribosomal protein S18]-alanine N-acetyltransferase
VSASVFLRRSRPEDVAGLVSLELAASAHPWNEAQIGAELARQAPDEVLALEGRLGLRAWCAYRLAVGELQILNLAVHPQERRRGLGRFLLEAALRAGERAGASRALLEVRASNSAARTLYALFGFVPLGERKQYYSLPPEDALVLARELAGVSRDRP